MTNYLKTAYDQLITYIKTQYPRFIDPDRIQLAMVQDGELVIDKTALGYEDCMIIYVDSDAETTTTLMTSGQSIVDYTIKIIYYKPKVLKNQLDEISNFVDAFCNWMKENYAHVSGKWINLGTDVSYDPPVPEDYEGRLFGAEITVHFSVGKY